MFVVVAKVANVVLTKLQRMSEAIERPSFFRKAFVPNLESLAKTKRNQLLDDHFDLHSNDDVIMLTKSTLGRFKQALFVRLDDSSTSTSVNEKQSMIQLMISKIIRYVDLVGWPDTEDEATNYYYRDSIMPFLGQGEEDCHFETSILSPSNKHKFNSNFDIQKSHAAVKSSDWCLFNEQVSGTIVTEKENVDKVQGVNVARSTIPSDLFDSPRSISPFHSILERRGEEGGFFSFDSLEKNVERKQKKMNPTENLSLYLHSPDKATEEIFRLADVASMKQIDKATKSYCLNRIEYLKIILEENGYHNISTKQL